MHNDTSTQTEAQRLINKNDLKREMRKLFGVVYESNKGIFSPLENDKTKVQNVKNIKQYLKQNHNLYSIAIVFIGGMEREYKTAIQIDLLF